MHPLHRSLPDGRAGCSLSDGCAAMHFLPDHRAQGAHRGRADGAVWAARSLAATSARMCARGIPRPSATGRICAIPPFPQTTRKGWGTRRLIRNRAAPRARESRARLAGFARRKLVRATLQRLAGAKGGIQRLAAECGHCHGQQWPGPFCGANGPRPLMRACAWPRDGRWASCAVSAAGNLRQCAKDYP